MKKIRSLIKSFFLAFSFLTVIPIRFKKAEEREIKNSIIFYPAVGLFYGIILYLALLFLFNFKISLEFTAFIILALPFSLNKFLHFDGLCDTVDAFFADRTPEERLIILKDSRIGSFALGFGVLFIILKFLIIKKFLETYEIATLIIIIPVFSRYFIILLSAFSKYPRKNGTASFIVGKIKPIIFIFSSLVFFMIIAIFQLKNPQLFIYTISITLFSFIFTFLFKVYSYKKIKGVTGDILGAFIELLELFLLITAVICYKVL